MVPHCVPEVMKNLVLLALEIERSLKIPKTEFSSKTIPCIPGGCNSFTHDMSTIRGWWGRDGNKTERFPLQIYAEARYGQAPFLLPNPG